jgi:hypothetical protein
MTISTIFILVILLSVVGSLLLLRGTTGSSSWPDRVSAFLAPPLCVLCIAETASKILSADDFIWNEIRLARTFGLYSRIPLYPGRDATGPILGTLHTPLSHILYWPATLAGSPISAVRSGVSLSVLVVLLALLYVHREAASNFRVAAATASPNLPHLLRIVIALELFWIVVLNTTVLSCVFVVHADPIALACATLAGGLLSRRPLVARRLFLSALFAILAIASKQTFAALPVALAIFIFIVEGGKTLARYCLYLAGWTAIVAAAILAIFRPAKDLAFNLFTLPSHRPLQPSVLTLPHLHDGFRFICIRLYGIARYSVHTGSEGRAFACFILLLCLWVWLLRRHSAAGERPGLRKAVSNHRWLVFVFIALILFPLLFKASITVGGDENHLAIADFFLLLGLTTSWLHRSTRPATFPDLLIFTLVLIVSYRATLALSRPSASVPSLTVEAADFSSAHPGVAYFPSNPLSSVYSAHRFYTVDHAVDDREIAGFPLTPAQFASGLPADATLIAIQPRLFKVGEVSHALLLYLDSGWIRETNTDLPDFTVYRRTSPSH